MRRYNTQAEMDNIPNVSFKRNAICQNYMSYGTTTDIQTYLEEQLVDYSYYSQLHQKET